MTLLSNYLLYSMSILFVYILSWCKNKPHHLKVTHFYKYTLCWQSHACNNSINSSHLTLHYALFFISIFLPDSYHTTVNQHFYNPCVTLPTSHVVQLKLFSNDFTFILYPLIHLQSYQTPKQIAPPQTSTSQPHTYDTSIRTVPQSPSVCGTINKGSRSRTKRWGIACLCTVRQARQARLWLTAAAN